MTTDSELEALLYSISLEGLKDRARDLRRAAEAGESEARQRVEPYFGDPSGLKLQQAQLVIARECGFKSWRKLKSFVELRDTTMEARQELANVQARMRPSMSLIDEYHRANRRVRRLAERLQKTRPAGPPILEIGTGRQESRDGEARETSLCCSFCNKSHHEVPKLIAGPGGFICNECVMLCLEILQDEIAASS